MGACPELADADALGEAVGEAEDVGVADGLADGDAEAPGVCLVRWKVALIATPFPSRVRFTGFVRPKSLQFMLSKDPLSRAAMNVNRLFPVSATGEATFANRTAFAAMNGVSRLSMLAQ